MASESPEHSENGASLNDFFIARQPIFDRQLRIYGYELLHRGDESQQAQVSDPHEATARVLLEAFVEVGLERLVGNHYAFININPSLLTSTLDFPFMHPRVALDILPSAGMNHSALDAIRDFAAKGFLISLDGFDFSEENRPLFDLADILKIDIADRPLEEIEEEVRKHKGRRARLAAKRVESNERYEFCRGLGFELFQGFFLARPDLRSHKRLPGSMVSTVRLLAKLEDPKTRPKDLEALIKADAALTYKILRWVNSAYYGLDLKIESISHAIVYLGVGPLRNWLRLMMLAKLDARSPELLVIAAIRGRMSEQLALQRDDGALAPEIAFTVGLFSLLDALMESPMPEILSWLPLPDEVEGALLEGKGPYGELLRLVKAYESGNWPELDGCGIGPEVLTEAYLEALEWVQSQEF